MKSKRQFIRKMAAPVMVVVMLVLFVACTKEQPKTEIIDLGDIPEVYLPTVQYQDGDVVRMMRESDSLIINYRVSRYRFSSLDDPSGWDSSPIIYDYQVDWTELTSDQFTYEMGIALTSEYRRYELEGVAAPKRGYISLFKSDTYVPFINTDASGYIVQNHEINGHVYCDVFRLDCEPDYKVTEEDIYTVTCYYSYEKGFIGMEMSNGEKYWLFEE